MSVIESRHKLRHREGVKMSVWLIVLCVYLVLGIISTIIVVAKEPLILYGWWLLPIIVLIFPYALWAVFTQDNSGRWI
jgi:lipopolysaccharide export LptBFGC system permease protein LptF